MLLEVGRRAETFATLWTGKWSLASVYAQVLPQIAGRLKGTRALGAGKRPLACVSSFVLPQICGCTKRTVTMRTREGPLTRVRSSVLPQVALSVEPLLAHIACIGPYRGCVAYGVVLPQVAGTADNFLADGTHLWSPPSRNPAGCHRLLGSN